MIDNRGKLQDTKNMPRPDVNPTGAAELLYRNKTAGSRIIPASYKFSILYNFLARPIHESLRRGVSLFIKKYAIWKSKCPALTAPTVNRHLITDNRGKLSTSGNACRKRH